MLSFFFLNDDLVAIDSPFEFCVLVPTEFIHEMLWYNRIVFPRYSVDLYGRKNLVEIFFHIF